MSDSTPMAPSRLSAAWRYALALLISVVAWGVIAIAMRDANVDDEPIMAWFLFGDTALGLASFVLIRWRHRWPGPIAVLTSAFSFFSATSTGPAAWALGSVASRNRWRLLLLLLPLNVAAGIVQERIYPGEGDLPLWASLLFGFLVVGIVVAIGYAMGFQRNLMDSLRERALTAEREQQARVAQAQAAERTRIAREMHDVLAHRISLVAMHAGALSYRTDLTPEEQATAAKALAATAHHALRDLRDVLGVLRDPMVPTDSAPEQPQPVIADIARLVQEERASGMHVSLEEAITGELSDGRARTAHRIVQEALTNARKHAPGTSVMVTLSGNPEDGLSITIRNAAPVGTRQSDLPDSGLGLIGLDERASLAGGRLTHGFDAPGGFVVDAWIPWQA